MKTFKKIELLGKHHCGVKFVHHNLEVHIYYFIFKNSPNNGCFILHYACSMSSGTHRAQFMQFRASIMRGGVCISIKTNIYKQLHIFNQPKACVTYF